MRCDDSAAAAGCWHVRIALHAVMRRYDQVLVILMISNASRIAGFTQAVKSSVLFGCCSD